MDIAQVSLLGGIAVILLLLFVFGERGRKKSATQKSELGARLEELVEGIKLQSTLISKIIDVETGVIQSNASIITDHTKLASSIAESVAAQGRKLETTLSDLEQRCKEMISATKHGLEIHEGELRDTSREFRKESEQRSLALADLIKSITDQLKQTSTGLQEKIVEDSLARDGRLGDMLNAIQKESSETVSSIEKAFASEESKRSAKTDQLIVDLKNQLERLTTSTDSLLHSLEESVKF